MNPAQKIELRLRAFLEVTHAQARIWFLEHWKQALDVLLLQRGKVYNTLQQVPALHCLHKCSVNSLRRRLAEQRFLALQLPGAEAMQAELADIERRLSSKRAFELAAADLQTLILTAFAKGILCDFLIPIERALRRVLQLLRSRYTSIPYWQAGQNLFVASQAVITEPKLAKELQDAVEECKEVVSAVEVEVPGAPFLFEGQLSTAAPTSSSGTATSYETIQRLLGELAVLAESDTTDGAQSASQQATRTASREELEADLIGALSHAGFLEEAEQPRRAPPASRTVVQRLKRLAIDDASLVELGGKGASCSICREDFSVGDEAQIMPCSDAHAFHPSCLRPWLLENNSCPICRYELETEDMKYEAKKAREKQDEEDMIGAANAQSHNEFLYI